MMFRTVTAALALLGSTSLIGGVYAEATPSDSVIDKLDITLDGADGEGMGVNVKAHITSDAIDRLIAAGFTSLFSSEALAKPSGLHGGHPVVPLQPVVADNNILMTNKSGVLVTNYPFQFGRPFVCGEIANYPQILVNNAPIPTQADVKNRCQDGSAKFVVISGIIPQIPIQGVATLTFQNQLSGNNTPLSKAAMLDAGYDFEATMALAFTGGHAGNASARTMLNNGNYKLWTSGGIAQTIELADDTVARAYDIGNGDGHRPFRPRFYATFWPTTHQVTVRYVGEVNLTSDLEDLAYTLTLNAGLATPAQVYSIDLTNGANKKLHRALTNWTRTTWIGGAPEPKINIDHNLKYLSATRYLPNYDSSLVMPEANIASGYVGWRKLLRDIFNSALWQTGMGVSGGRADIGPYPEWTVNWFYRGDWRLREIALTQADLAGAFPAQLRETNPGKNLNIDDVAGAGTGLGHTMSIANRPSMFTGDLTYSYIKPADRVTIVGPMSNGPWSFNGAHMYAPYFPQYILTGDPYYLSQMWLWAGFAAANSNGAGGSRGPSGTLAVVNSSLRGQAWVYRNIAEAFFAAPDDAPEKKYFGRFATGALARWEGGLQITGTTLDNTPEKVFGAKVRNLNSINHGPNSGKPPTLHNWESAGDPRHPELNASVMNLEAKGVLQPGTVGSFTAPWTLNYLLYSLGRASELGLPAEPLLRYTGKWYTDVILHSGYPHFMSEFQIPVERKGGGFMTFEEILTQGFTPSYTSSRFQPPYGSMLSTDGYYMYASGGLANMVDIGVPEARETWAWFKANVFDLVPRLNTSPKWAIVPRS